MLSSLEIVESTWTEVKFQLVFKSTTEEAAKLKT